MRAVEGNPPTRLIFVTQVIDPDDAVLGFVIELIRDLSHRCDRLVVIANEVRRVPDDLSVEIVSLRKERGYGRLRRTIRYLVAVWRQARGMPADGLIAHMCPVYLNLAAPLTKLLGVRNLLWFAHPSRSIALRIAEKVTDVIVTSLPAAYPRNNVKLVAIGQATPLRRFPLVELRTDSSTSLQAIALGRTSIKKDYQTMIRGVSLAREAGVDVTLYIVGPSTTPAEQAHRGQLAASIAKLGAAGYIHLEDGVAPSEIPQLIASSDVLVNSTVAGSGDKAVFEAMASGRLVLVSNPAFFELLSDLPLELTFAPGDAIALADRLAQLSTASPELRWATVRELRSRIESAHSSDSWAERIVTLAHSGL